MVEIKELNEELKKATNLNQIISTLNKYYDLDAPLTPMNKGFILTGLQTVIDQTGIKKR